MANYGCFNGRIYSRRNFYIEKEDGYARMIMRVVILSLLSGESKIDARKNSHQPFTMLCIAMVTFIL